MPQESTSVFPGSAKRVRPESRMGSREEVDNQKKTPRKQGHEHEKTTKNKICTVTQHEGYYWKMRNPNSDCGTTKQKRPMNSLDKNLMTFR